jgi:hypothetical protein
MASGAPYSKAHRAARCPAIRKSGPGFARAAWALLLLARAGLFEGTRIRTAGCYGEKIWCARVILPCESKVSSNM